MISRRLISLLRCTSIILPKVSHYSTTASSSTTTNKGYESVSNFGSSISVDELNKFKKLSQAWWIESGEFEALHKLNELRVPWIRDTLFFNNETSQKDPDCASGIVREPLKGLNLLDVGCGGGILSEPLARLGAQVVGLDAVRENIIIAQNHLNTFIGTSDEVLLQRLKYVHCTIEDLALSDDNSQFFDAICISEVIEHVENPEIFLQNAAKLLKNRGFIFLTTLNKTYVSYALGIFMAENVLKLVPAGTHDWNKFLTPDQISQMLEKRDQCKCGSGCTSGDVCRCSDSCHCRKEAHVCKCPKDGCKCGPSCKPGTLCGSGEIDNCKPECHG